MKAIKFLLIYVCIASCVGGGLRKNDLTAHFLDSNFYKSGQFEEDLDLIVVNIVSNERFNGIDTLCRYELELVLPELYRQTLKGLGNYVFELEIRENSFVTPTRFLNVEEPKTFDIKHYETRCNNGFEYLYRLYVRSRIDGNLVHISNEKTFTFTP